jgi:hypothetical protein
MAAGLSLAGCNALEGQYFRQGIGTDLPWSDVATATELQNIYLEHLCRQSAPYIGAQAPGCFQGEVPPNFWPLIVQAGMNDIDQRCDGYLAWLDQRKRENAGILTELAAVRFAVDAITNPAITHGIGPRSLAAIAAAFGLATNTVNNLNSLLLQVDHNTVQAVVYRWRGDLRGQINTLITSRSIDNKPAVVHVLRSYLSACMPMNIAANINSRITVLQAAGVSISAPDARPKIDPKPLVTNPPRTDPSRDGSTRTIFRPDNSTAVLEKFLDPDGTGIFKSDSVAAVTPFLTRKGLRTRDLVRFLRGPEFATQRSDLVSELKRDGKL